jgi:hypothetical protein
MKGRKTRASGGVNQAAEDLGRKNMRYTYESNVNKEAVERKSGGKTVGKVKGMDAMAHAGRKARKSGGSCDSGSPFSSARQGTPAKGRNVSGSIN